MSHIIQKKMDPTYIDSADTVATLRNDFSSDKMIMFGQPVDTDPLSFKAGEQFLVVCGEREAVRKAKYMLPVPLWASVKVYPIELIMQSEQYSNKSYEDVFADVKIETTEKQKREPAAKLSVHKQLEKNKAAIDGRNQNMEPEERENSQHNRDLPGR